MRTLTSTLLAAQKSASAIPFVQVTAAGKCAGVARLRWERLYSGTEDDYFHAAALAHDGSLIRVRVTPPADNCKLYRQRIASPGPSSDFSQWTYMGQYGVAAVACAASGTEVSIFWTTVPNRKIQCITSTDGGATWSSVELIEYSPTDEIGGLAAAYKPDGDLAIFFADSSRLHAKQRIDGAWQEKALWDKSTGELSGVAAVYDGDWHLLITGKDAAGNFKLWSLVYGDGEDVPAGDWSPLKEAASAPADGAYAYLQPFLDQPDAHRCFFVEKFSGSEAANQPFWSHTAVGSRYVENLWREPAPFNLSCEYGLAIAHHGDYCWLSSPSSVWRAGLSMESLDLTPDITGLRQEAGYMQDKLVVELRNDSGQYNHPGEGNLARLIIGCQLDFSPGYRTAAGNEASAGHSFTLGAYEHTSAGGKASLILHGESGWDALCRWRARHQFRWNRASDEMNVKELIMFILARAGLYLEVKSESETATGFYPDFTVHPGDKGDAIISKLLSFIPDVLFIEGAATYLVNPLATDESVYGYGTAHAIYEGGYRSGAWEYNRVLVEGRDEATGEPLIINRIVWDEIERYNDHLLQVSDRNLETVTQAQQRGAALLRHAEMESVKGSILIPVNCGQQLYDVVDITDGRVGLSGVKRRVVGYVLTYQPRRGEYRQKLLLGGV